MPTKKKNNNKRHRPSWDDYFLEIMEAAKGRATCDRGRSAAVIVKDRSILTTGYVGSAAGLPHCDDAGHDIKEVINPDGTTSKHCVRTSHAEENAIVQAAKGGIRIDGATIYCNMEPCIVCARMIINSGIKRVVCKRRYHGAAKTREYFKEAGIKLEVLENGQETYAEMK
jgi:dCMP deaminase